MEATSTKETKTKMEVLEDAQAQVDIWKYILGFTPTAVVKCAIELGIPDVLETHGGAMTLPELSASLNCSSSILYRIMRYLTSQGIFKQSKDVVEQETSVVCYSQTPLSRLLMKNEMASLVLMQSSPEMLGPWHSLSSRVLIDSSSPFKSANGEDLWKYTAANPSHSKLFNDGMASHARLAVAAIIYQYPEAFQGIGSLVDVGGGDGTSLGILVKACPWIGGINFDLPHVVSVAPHRDGVEHVAGDMFQSVPRADAAFLMWVLHDWSDTECIQILRNCREAILKDKGKVIIIEAVVEEGGDHQDKYSNVPLVLDMLMLAHTETGKERSWKEWEYVVNAAGFIRCTAKLIDQAIVSVIEAYP